MIATPTNMFYTVTLPCTLWFFDRGKQDMPEVKLEPGEDGESLVGTRTLHVEDPDPIGATSPQKKTDDEPTNYPPRGRNTVLFIDAREIFRQIDRAHRDWRPEQIEYLSNIVRLYRGKEPEDLHGGLDLTAEQFPALTFKDIPGLCKVATIEEIEEQGWSLNPGRYVGVTDREEDDGDFKLKLEGLYEELELLNGESKELEKNISSNIQNILSV
ncbi:N-6 DNA methylase [Candidatus Dojkabacteria bacterium]|nr:N-6 DNA methylase [Candidatus Dojkabacteria bacterium]